jgi:hypothetical protein
MCRDFFYFPLAALKKMFFLCFLIPVLKGETNSDSVALYPSQFHFSNLLLHLSTLVKSLTVFSLHAL